MSRSWQSSHVCFQNTPSYDRSSEYEYNLLSRLNTQISEYSVENWSTDLRWADMHVCVSSRWICFVSRYHSASRWHWYWRCAQVQCICLFRSIVIKKRRLVSGRRCSCFKFSWTYEGPTEGKRSEDRVEVLPLASLPSSLINSGLLHSGLEAIEFNLLWSDLSVGSVFICALQSFECKYRIDYWA